MKFHLMVILVSVFFVILQQTLIAAPFKQFSPPTKIKLEMLALTPDGEKDSEGFTDPHCSSTGATRLAYGCTYFHAKPKVENERQEPYPFTSHEVEIGYETEIKRVTLSNGSQDDIQLGYLHNVVAQEMSEGSTLSSYTAQAIAARTYAYYQTNGTIRINNSSAKQVYVPYRFEGMGGATPALRQLKLHNAVTSSSSLYMTLPDSTEPIVAYFGQDNDEYTTHGTLSHLVGIYDPISEAEGKDVDVGFGGMSSAGASRWGYGNTSEINRGQEWSVQWGEDPGIVSGQSWRNGFQIVSHYYTDIIIRNSAGVNVLPDYRWNPLKVTWSGVITPPKMTRGSNLVHNATVVLQNTGTVSWTQPTKWYLSYRWLKGNQIKTSSNPVQISSIITLGNHLTATLGIQSPPDWGTGSYTLTMDMFYQVGNGPMIGFSEAEPQRPWFTHNILFTAEGALICPRQVGVCGVSYSTYLPIIMKPGYIPPTPTATPTTISTVIPTKTVIPTTPTTTPVPADCWSDNLLDIGGAGNFDWVEGQPHTIKWKEINLLGEKPGEVVELSSLTTKNNYYSSPRALVLGGRDNKHDEQEAYDQYAFQHIQINNPDTIRYIEIKYAYYFSTTEIVSYVKDRFFVDLYNDLPELEPGNDKPPKNSILQNKRIEYNNLHSLYLRDEWRWRSNSEDENNDGELIVVIPDDFDLKRDLYLVFYSEIDKSLPSYLYVDDVQLRVSTCN